MSPKKSREEGSRSPGKGLILKFSSSKSRSAFVDKSKLQVRILSPSQSPYGAFLRQGRVREYFQSCIRGSVAVWCEIAEIAEEVTLSSPRYSHVHNLKPHPLREVQRSEPNLRSSLPGCVTWAVHLVMGRGVPGMKVGVYLSSWRNLLAELSL